MSTTLDPSRRYNLVWPGQLVYGYLEGGRYYDQDGHECGRLDGDTLISYMTLPDGRPSFPDHVAGTVNGLTLELVDGRRLEWVEVE